MAKINIKLDKEFLAQLTGSISKSSFDGNKKLQSLFNLINNHKNDNTVDIKEITDFTNSIFQADTNNDGEIDKSELNTYVKQNENLFKELKIKAKDILEFLNIFKENSDKTDINNQRITNSDGTYSIIFTEYEIKNKNLSISEVLKRKDLNLDKYVIKENYDTNNKLLTRENIKGDKRFIKDKDGNFISEQTYQNDRLISERKADGLIYYYEGNKTTIENQIGELKKEIIVLENGETINKEYKEIIHGKTVIISKNEQTGKFSKEYKYDDNYYITVNQGSVIELSKIKKIINEPLSEKNLWIILYCDENLINVLAKEEDINFQKTYITGCVDKLIELAEFVNIESKELIAIKDRIAKEGFESVSIDDIHTAYSALFEKIEKINPSIEQSQIKNEHYISEFNFNKVFTDKEIIIINTENNKKNIINLDELLKPFNENERSYILSQLKSMPAEVLLDLSIDATFYEESVDAGSVGHYNYVKDKIALKGGDYSKDTIIHELGHAIDCIGKNYENYATNNSQEFKQLFKKELDTYVAQGNKRCAQHAANNEIITYTDENNENYATLDEQEMFAECYVLLMTGTCNSKNVIEKYFPETLEYASKILGDIRKISPEKRHKT